MLIAIVGTTISPYLFFGQTAMEAEDIKAVKRQVMINNILVNINGDHRTKSENKTRENRLMGLLIQKIGLNVNGVELP